MKVSAIILSPLALDDWPGSDSPWWLLLQRPMEHPRLYRGGGSTGGLRPLVSCLSYMSESHIWMSKQSLNPLYLINVLASCSHPSGLFHCKYWYACSSFPFVFICGWCPRGIDQQQCDGVKKKNPPLLEHVQPLNVQRSSCETMWTNVKKYFFSYGAVLMSVSAFLQE